MRNLANVVPVLLVFFLFAATSTAEIKSVKLRSDNRGRVLFDYFKFTHTGHVSIAVSAVSVTFMPVTSNISQPDPSRFGFYLLSEEARSLYHDEWTWSNISCKLDSKYISLLFTFKDLPNPLQSSFNKSYPVTYPNEYSLYFSNCNPLSHVTMDVRTEVYNMDNGTIKDYLSAGMTKLPRLYFILSVIYLCFLGFWIFACFMNRTYISMVHILMGVLLVSKAIYLYCAAEVQQSVKLTGTPSHVWDVLFYIFQFVNPAILYTVLAAIFVGLSFWKSKAMIGWLVSIPLLGLATVLSKLTGVVGMNSDVPTLDSTGLWLLIVNTFGVIIIMPVIWICDDSDEEEQAGRNHLSTDGLLCGFCIMVSIYLFIDLILRVVINKLAYSYQWKDNAAEEINSFLFYILMFIMFMPSENHNYFPQLYVGSAEVRDVEV
ncbi:hypothetical protein L1887_36133 [Cichorium endivia]|nr:hypothetical protein L1887_36133 [Cichorium endivia]